MYVSSLWLASCGGELTEHRAVTDPEDLTVWEWAFEHPKWSQTATTRRREDLSAFTNAATGERIDFLQVKEHATHISTALVRLYGLLPSDTISLFSGNTIWYPVVVFAALRAGARVNGASPAYNAEEMSYALRTAQTKFLLTLSESLPVALAAAKTAGIPTDRIFLLEGEATGFATVQQLLAIGKSYADSDQPAPFRIPKGGTNNVCAFLTFSSGTTGQSKAVSSHRQPRASSQLLKNG